MEKEKDLRAAGSSPRFLSGKLLLIGVAGSVAAVAWLTMGNKRESSRRFADRGQERRNPMHFFLAGRNPRRREIDRSGQRPLFERRQSVYDAY
jgi:hypothetical protein